MLKIEDGRLSFYQWDLNQRLVIDNPSIIEVHYTNALTSPALVCEVYEENGIRYANVPNILLQTDWTIKAYGCCDDYVIEAETFIVNTREKPADYVYTETEIKRYDDLEKRIDNLEQVGVQDVQVSGKSIVAAGVANVPIAGDNTAGVIKINSSYGIKVNNGALTTVNASQSDIKNRVTSNRIIVTSNMDYAVKAAMCDGKGAAWTADEQAAARERMGCYNGFTVLMDEVISEEAQNISFVLPSNASEFIAYFESYNTAAPYTGTPYLLFENVGDVNPISTMYSFFGATIKAGDINIKGIQKCVIINDEDVCVEYAAVSLNVETTSQSQNRSGRVGIAKRTSNKIEFHFTDHSFPIGTRFLVLVRCK